jgi:anti-sigma regulatory factor (Ser/Thr protein kinase)
MEMTMALGEPLLLEVEEHSQVAAARRAVEKAARDAGFDHTDRGRLAIVATELAGNILNHAGRGRLAIRTLDSLGARGVEILAIDSGPGMDVGEALEDGFSTRGSSGTGLGAARRLADEFDAYSERGKGTVVVARRWLGKARPPIGIGAVAMPKPGSPVNGDGWIVEAGRHGLVVALADGLGHGPLAAEAAAAAVALVIDNKSLPPAAILELSHANLHRTRGAALAIARLAGAEGRLHFAGVGNVAGRVLRGDEQRHLVSLNGTAGREIRGIQEYTEAWGEGATLVLHSDGVAGHWDLKEHPGLAARDAAVIAGLIFRDHVRGDDDATVVVVKA